MKKKLVALFLCCALTFGLVTAALITPASADTDFMVYQNGAPVTTVELPENGSVTVEALLNESASGNFQWQIMARGVWANIVGASGSSLTLRYAMLANVLNGDGQATVRCRFIPLGAEAMYSNILTVQMTSGDVATTIPVNDVNFDFTVLDPGSVVEHETATPAQEPAPTEDTIVSDNDTVPAEDAIVPADDAVPAEDVIVPAEDQIQLLAEGGTEEPAQQDGENADPVNDTPDVKTTYNVVINYVFADSGEVVSEPYMATLAEGSAFSATVTFPTVQGYLPYLYNEETSEYDIQQNSYVLDITNIQAGVTIDVVYKPTEVSYTVIHYQQNVGDDNYTEAERETKQGLTNTTVPEVAKKYTGFYSLIYERPAIAADGSTVIEIYYDRYYYLMLFDMDGGYGTDPIYGRYGAPLGTVNDPTKAGYKFAGWSLTKGGEMVDLPAAMPATNSTYYALWTPEDTAKVTIVFWGENADDEDYSYLDGNTKTINLKPGREFTYSEDSMLVCDREVHEHDESCIGCGKVEHTHSAVGGSCYTATCGITPHTHGPSCYPQTSNSTGSPGIGTPDSPSNGYVAREAFTRNDKLIYINGTWYKYTGSASTGTTVSATCGLQENSHAHGTSCYTLTCTTEEHTHAADCYTCGKTEHTHNSDCYMQGAGLDATKWKFVKSDTITVAADGSSVVNVYYDRREYSVRFYDNQTCSDNREYTSLRITAKWGQKILDKWPEYNNSKSWYVENENDTWQNSIQIMPVGGAKYWGPKTGRSDYTATYYVEALPGDNNTVDFQGKTFVFHHADTSSSSGSVTQEDKYGIQGFTYYGGTRNGDSYGGAKFYYSRDSYKLTFNNQENNINNSPISVLYEMPLGSYDFTPTEIPSWFEPGSVKFAGWYLNPQCTGKEYKLDKHTMPANDLILYAKWVPVTHTVDFHLTEDADVYTPKDSNAASFTVAHGGNIAKDYVDAHLTKEAMNDAKPNGGYNFVVWYYYENNDKVNGEKKYFDPTMQIRTDLCLYAEWSSNTLKQYTVQYVLQENHSVKVADDLNGSGLAGVTKTFDAKGSAELYAAYQEGYFPTVQSHSLKLDIDSNELVVIFEYVQKEAVPYTVKYINTATGDSVFNGQTVADKVVSDNRKAVVTETFKVIPGFMPDAYQKRLVVTADGENILYFYYTEDSTHAYYKITHYTENAAGTGWTVYAESQAQGDIGTTYTADPITIPGFTYDPEVEGALASGELTENGLDLKLYYTRNSYPYEFRFLELNTNKELETAATGNAKYQSRVTENAKEIPGYTLVSDEQQTITIAIEDPADEAVKNVKIFYYTEKKVNITYVVAGRKDGGTLDNSNDEIKAISETPTGSTPTANDNFEFVGWFEDEDCTIPVNKNWVDDNNKLTPGTTTTYGEKPGYEDKTYYAKFDYKLVDLQINKTGCTDPDQTFIFTVTGPGINQQIVIKGNGSVTLTGLKVGDTYTVTEDTSWSWRYTPKNGTQSIELKPSSNVITFENTRDNHKWLDGSAYCKNIFQTLSAETTN